MKKLHAIHTLVPLFTVLVAMAIPFLSKGGPNSLSILVAFLFPYIFPLIIHKIQMKITPIPLGESYIEKKSYHPWLASYRIQHLYIMFPIFERIIMLVPGLFPLWLRAWGSKIGKNVYIAPTVQIHDRNLIEIGDNVVIGDGTILVSHMVTIKKGRTRVFCLPIKITNNKLIGAYSLLSPGTELEKIDQLPSYSLCAVGEKDRYFSLAEYGIKKAFEKKKT